MTTKYQFKIIKTATVQEGYARLEIVNSFADVDESDAGQMALVAKYGGVKCKPAGKTQDLKPVKKAGK